MQQWTPDEDAAAPLFRQAVELGVTFWDTANVYQGGTSEEIVGRAISRFARREDIVLATKVSGKMHDGARRERPVPQGNPRTGGRLPAAAGHRLHRGPLHPPLDDQTPVEETMAPDASG
jgi:1-deoxyxylulose-5-phosphate synthase